MVDINATFDGKVLVPDKPLNLPAGQTVRVRVEQLSDRPPSALPPAIIDGKRVFNQQRHAIKRVASNFDDELGEEFWFPKDDPLTDPSLVLASGDGRVESEEREGS